MVYKSRGISFYVFTSETMKRVWRNKRDFLPDREPLFCNRDSSRGPVRKSHPFTLFRPLLDVFLPPVHSPQTSPLWSSVLFTLELYHCRHSDGWDSRTQTYLPSKGRTIDTTASFSESRDPWDWRVDILPLVGVTSLITGGKWPQNDLRSLRRTVFNRVIVDCCYGTPSTKCLLFGLRTLQLSTHGSSPSTKVLRVGRLNSRVREPEILEAFGIITSRPECHPYFICKERRILSVDCADCGRFESRVRVSDGIPIPSDWWVLPLIVWRSPASVKTGTCVSREERVTQT